MKDTSTLQPSFASASRLRVVDHGLGTEPISKDGSLTEPVSQRRCYINCRRVPAKPDPKSSPFRCLSIPSMRLKKFADCHDKNEKAGAQR
jgi:hypothetical protein